MVNWTEEFIVNKSRLQERQPRIPDPDNDTGHIPRGKDTKGTLRGRKTEPPPAVCETAGGGLFHMGA